MISIILPLYNASATLERCIRSLLSQRYREFELLCIDDGSNDDTLHRLRNLASTDQRIRLFTKQNGGVSSARNVGLDNAQGEFVTFVDSDDWVEPEWLSTYMEHYRGEDLLYQNAVWDMSDGRHIRRSVEVERSDNTIAKILRLYDRHTIGYVWSALFRREIIELHTIRFCEEIAYCEDYEFVLHYCLHIDDLNIIPPTQGSYHYIFPQDERIYQSIDHRRVLASIMVGQRGAELEQRYRTSTSAINIRTSSDILYTIAMAYRTNIDRDERLRIVRLVADAPYSMKFKTKRGRLLYWLTTHLPTTLTDRALSIIYRTKRQ
ncbi:MAG: glycosyltransferase family 2 protein [Rikenellaceae bacterium]